MFRKVLEEFVIGIQQVGQLTNRFRRQPERLGNLVRVWAETVLIRDGRPDQPPVQYQSALVFLALPEFLQWLDGQADFLPHLTHEGVAGGRALLDSSARQAPRPAGQYVSRTLNHKKTVATGQNPDNAVDNGG